MPPVKLWPALLPNWTPHRLIWPLIEPIGQVARLKQNCAAGFSPAAESLNTDPPTS